MTSNYPLPRANQECWTKWYNHTITHGALKNKTILWVAQELPCRFKSEQVKDIIGPHHVFILKLNDTFSYGVIDETETMYRLPKKYYTACFPEYNIHRFQRITGVKLNCRGEEPSNCHIFQSLSWNKRGPKPLERGDAQM